MRARHIAGRFNFVRRNRRLAADGCTTLMAEGFLAVARGNGVAVHGASVPAESGAGGGRRDHRLAVAGAVRADPLSSTATGAKAGRLAHVIGPRGTDRRHHTIHPSEDELTR